MDKSRRYRCTRHVIRISQGCLSMASLASSIFIFVVKSLQFEHSAFSRLVQLQRVLKRITCTEEEIEGVEDDHLLSNANANYKPALLLMDQAVELFNRHAFQKTNPPDGYTELSNRAVHFTGRLPLALKVLGSFYRGRQAGVWEGALNRLAKTPDRDIFDTLEMSFNGLHDYEKKIFLDLACFFKGEYVEDVTEHAELESRSTGQFVFPNKFSRCLRGPKRRE
nr:TMV resistance protein N-like [Tanacetum cinerariifolium]